VAAAGILGARLTVPSHAEAYLGDPLAAYVLASTIEGAGDVFLGLMARDAPGTRALAPDPGECIVFG